MSPVVPDLDHLEQLARAATEGPWTSDGRDVFIGGPGAERWEATGFYSDADVAKNAAFIVAACNAVPELVQRLRAAEGEALQAGVRYAGRSRACPMCGLVWSEPGPCPTCSERLATAEAIVKLARDAVAGADWDEHLLALGPDQPCDPCDMGRDDAHTVLDHHTVGVRMSRMLRLRLAVEAKP